MPNTPVTIVTPTEPLLPQQLLDEVARRFDPVEARWIALPDDPAPHYVYSWLFILEGRHKWATVPVTFKAMEETPVEVPLTVVLNICRQVFPERIRNNRVVW